MVDKMTEIQNLDNLIKKLNLILSDDKRFENEINYDYYLKKMSKEKKLENLEIPIRFLPEYNVQFTKNIYNNNIHNYKEKYYKLLKEIEMLADNISISGSTYDTSLLLSEIDKLKKNTQQNLKELQNL
jgi:hypothetical protein